MEQIIQVGGLLRSFLAWIRNRPASAFLFFAVTGTVVYFFAFLPLYANHSQPIWHPKVRQPDITRAKQVFDWEPKVAFEQGIVRTIDYFRQWIARASER